MSEWLSIVRGDAPLILAFPHTGTFIPPDIEQDLTSPWLARKDTDWGVDRLYDFAGKLGATSIRTAVSRTVIDVNRDPSGASLYPGQATTSLCPLSTFDGETLYRAGRDPDGKEIARRREVFFDPYHAALAREIERLRRLHRRIVLYDAHAIRSVIPRLFEGTLPNLNIGTDNGRTASRDLARAVEVICDRSNFSHVSNGRFRGGWTTRRYGDPARGVHAIQMELAFRSYMDEPPCVSVANWPRAYHEERAAALRMVLGNILESCLTFSKESVP